MASVTPIIMIKIITRMLSILTPVPHEGLSSYDFEKLAVK